MLPERCLATGDAPKKSGVYPQNTYIFNINKSALCLCVLRIVRYEDDSDSLDDYFREEGVGQRNKRESHGSFSTTATDHELYKQLSSSRREHLQQERAEEQELDYCHQSSRPVFIETGTCNPRATVPKKVKVSSVSSSSSSSRRAAQAESTFYQDTPILPARTQACDMNTLNSVVSQLSQMKWESEENEFEDLVTSYARLQSTLKSIDSPIISKKLKNPRNSNINLINLNSKKNEIRKEIDAYVVSFEKRHGRPPTLEERATSLVAYELIKSQIRDTLTRTSFTTARRDKR